jgi:hypothetical protein
LHEGFQFGGPSGGASDRRAFLAMVRADCGSAPDLRVAIEDFQYVDLGGGAACCGMWSGSAGRVAAVQPSAPLAWFEMGFGCRCTNRRPPERRETSALTQPSDHPTMIVIIVLNNFMAQLPSIYFSSLAGADSPGCFRADTKLKSPF